jgi:tRNA threonylcarbamoyladenosine biosynthesis protein TsaE
MPSFKTTAYIETTENQLQGVIDAILGRDLSAWVCDYPFGESGPDLIALEGNLGAGKTTLSKLLCAAWGCRNEVSSPTFALVNEYELLDFKGKLYHHDWYRVKEAGELYDAGIEEILHEYPSKHLIEWPEIGDFLLSDLAENYKAKVLWVNIEHKENSREYRLRILTPHT